MKKGTITRIIAGIALTALLVFIAAQFIPEKPKQLEEQYSESVESANSIRNDGFLRFLGNSGNPLTEISIEIAESEAARTQGLMGRTRIAEKEGMLFIFPEEEERSFWMANTPLPLDIIFVNSAFSIVRIHMHTKPYSEESLPSGSPAKYVVEVNAGFCNKFGVSEGQTISWNRK